MKKPLGHPDPKIRVNTCMTQSQRDKLRRLGGSKFIQVAIEQAPEPKTNKRAGK